MNTTLPEGIALSQGVKRRGVVICLREERGSGLHYKSEWLQG